MSDEQTASCDHVVAELARLIEENVRLRSMLGLDERKADGHATAWSPMLISDVADSPSVDHSSPNHSKLALVASLRGPC